MTVHIIVYGHFFNFQYKTARKSRKIFHLSDCVKITDKNMLKLSNRIGCNDSPSSLENQQTESMTEKFFRGLFSLDFSSLTVGKVESGVWGRSTPKTNKKNYKTN